MAITNSLPPWQWYWDTTSEWTLDYPPFFAWFEFGLSQIASALDTNMVNLNELNYASSATVYFQRASVVVSDAVLLAGVYAYSTSWTSQTTTEVPFSNKKQLTAVLITLFDAGLLMVDHIHFQYNGMLLGLLLGSVALLRQGRDVAGALMFSVLLMFKHIYLYAALLYFVYLFRHYCCRAADPMVVTTGRAAAAKTRRRRSLSATDPLDIDQTYDLKHFSVRRFATLALVVLVVVGIAFASVLPLTEHRSLNKDHQDDVLPCLLQILQRLFPVQRGLCHAYWAPNVWALYAVVDKVGYRLIRWIARASPWLPVGISSTTFQPGSLSKGLVQEAQFSILPSVPASATVVLTVLFMLPVLKDVWRRPHPAIFNPALVYCMLTSFMLGYHVHEKAILQVLVPMAVMSMESLLDARLYCMLAFTAHVSLFPLFFTPQEIVSRLLLVITNAFLVVCVLHVYLRASLRERRIRGDGLRFTQCQKRYGVGLVVVAVSTSGMQLGTPSVLLQAFPFLPQLITSVYCASGMVYCWRAAYLQHRRKMLAIEAYCTEPGKKRKPAAKASQSNHSSSELDILGIPSSSVFAP